MSRFTVRAFAGGMLSALGHNPILAIRDFSGEVRFDPSALDQSALHLRIRAASLEIQNDASEKDKREMKRVMDDEVLESARYPEIVFNGTAAQAAKAGEGGFRLQVDGSLQLHGVTRPEKIMAQVAVSGDTLRAFGDFTLRQTDYRIKLASVAGGALKLKDELKFAFDIVARRKSET